jgi:MFS family permease
MILRTSPTFRRLWLGQAVSVIGDGMQRIALLWWASQTGGTGLTAAVALCSVVPVVVCSPIGGMLADRGRHRRQLLLADTARCAITAALAALVSAGGPSPAMVCVLVALSAVASAVFDPAYAAALPTIVAEKDRPEANGLDMANSAVGGLAGPLLGGVLIASFGVDAVLAINAVTFAWSAAFIVAAQLPTSIARTASDPSEVTDRTKVSDVLRDPAIRRLLGLTSVLNMVVAPVPLLIVSLAVHRFGVGARAFGLLEMMISAGILIGAVNAGRLARFSVSTAMVTLGVCLAAVGLLPYGGSAAALLVCGIAIALANSLLISGFQNVAPPDAQGRLFGLIGSMSEGLRPLGLALGAPLLAVAGEAWAFFVVGVAVVAATAVWGRSSKDHSRSPLEVPIPIS